MNCSSCGEICRCPKEPPPTVSSDTLANLSAREQQFAPNPGKEGDTFEATRSDTALEVVDDSAWRDELSERLNRYRARRKIRPPRYPSLRLPFTPVEPVSRPDVSPAASFEPLSNNALALDGLRPSPTASLDVQVSEVPETAPSLVSATNAHAGAKIIEFPRFNFEPVPPPPDQLAEPVSDGLRILEAPEIAPPPPALGGITIEPAQRQEFEKRPGIDIPLQAASLSQRIFASVVDGAIVAFAAGTFGLIFWKITAIRPPSMQTMGLAAGIPCLFWAIYQYLLIVYTGGTPGLRAARLELTKFDGSTTSRSLRRWRVIASYLSAASLGMGYIWVFLDEDVLCWHDRITHTFLAPGKRIKPEPPKT